MQDDTALYGAKMMQPVMTPADNEENNLRPQHLEDYIGQEKAKQNLTLRNAYTLMVSEKWEIHRANLTEGKPCHPRR